MEVEEQEPDRRAGQRERHPRDERLRYLWQERNRPERRRGDGGDTGGETVESVDEVERYVHADDPETGEGDREREAKLDEPATERVVDEVDTYAGRRRLPAPAWLARGLLASWEGHG